MSGYLARADLARLVDPYRSAAEREWAQIGALWLGDYFKQDVVRMDYEPAAFKIPGGRYTPDFMSVLADGRLVFTEIKGSKRQKNYRDARAKLRAAAEVYPFFIWTQATRNGGYWEFEEIKP